MFWPETSPAKAAANLRQTLSRIRAFQSEHEFALLRCDATAVFMDGQGEASFDVLELLNRLNDPNPRAAVDLCSLYSGELLADLPGSSGDFEDWLALQRALLRDRCTERLSDAIALASNLGERERSFCAQKLLELDPCNEEAYCYLMVQAAQHGHRSRVHVLFDQCQRHLMRELGVRPSARTLHMFHQVLNRLDALTG